MLYWIIQVFIISVLFILLVHYIIDYLKNTFTTHKVKDLVNIRNQKYEDIYNTIQNKEQQSDPPQYTIEELLPKTDSSMKTELKNFLKSQLNANTDTTDIGLL